MYVFCCCGFPENLFKRGLIFLVRQPSKLLIPGLWCIAHTYSKKKVCRFRSLQAIYRHRIGSANFGYYLGGRARRGGKPFLSVCKCKGMITPRVLGQKSSLWKGLSIMEASERAIYLWRKSPREVEAAGRRARPTPENSTLNIWAEKKHILHLSLFNTTLRTL